MPPGSGRTWSGSLDCWQAAPSGRVFRVAEAHRRIEAGGLDGKLVLCPNLPL